MCRGMGRTLGCDASPLDCLHGPIEDLIGLVMLHGRLLSHWERRKGFHDVVGQWMRRRTRSLPSTPNVVRRVAGLEPPTPVPSPRLPLE